MQGKTRHAAPTKTVMLRLQKTVMLREVAASGHKIKGKSMMTKDAYVYILTNKKHGVLYTGVTNDLQRRMYEHKHRLVSGFSSKYNTSILVWFLHGESIIAAIELEKKIKNRGRQWKINLIERSNGRICPKTGCIGMLRLRAA